MNAVIVSVDYADLLAVTLPYNRAHFDRVLVITDGMKGDKEVALQHGCEVYLTDAFYRYNTPFNKFLALEEGLDASDFRKGWMAFLDADIVWPKHTPGMMDLKIGNLYTPLRRVAANPSVVIPIQEYKWVDFPHHNPHEEFAGYTQIFHANDPCLPANPPWHQTDWIHAGGADSFFQQLWPGNRKIRPPFEVLHLGPVGVNWFGRTVKRLDGTVPAESEERTRKQQGLTEERKRTGFTKEKLRHD
jgi:hypothetical protein